MTALRPIDRGLLFAAAWVGTIGYAWVLGYAAGSPWAQHVALAAALSWPVLGLGLLYADRAPGRVWRQADVCLRTMPVGLAVLLLGAALTPPTLPAQIAVLVAADVAMGAAFTVLSPLRPAVAAGLWVVALNGPFVSFLGLLTALQGVLS